MDRLVDLYISGELTREQFTERKGRLEATRGVLDEEQARLDA